MEGYILGISCGYHDSAAALIKDGEVLGACEEERFTGIKHDSSFPVNTINWLYDEFKIEGSDIQSIAFYDNPKKKLKRIEKSVKRSPLIEYFNRKSTQTFDSDNKEQHIAWNPQDASDKAQNIVSSNVIFRLLKYLINILLNVTGLGSSLQVLYQKK